MAQPGDLSEKIEAMRQRTDSVNKTMDSLNESINNMLEKQNEEMMEQQIEQNQRNLDQFMAEQRAREADKSKRLWIRGAILLVALISLIYSWRKKKNAEKQAD